MREFKWEDWPTKCWWVWFGKAKIVGHFRYEHACPDCKAWCPCKLEFDREHKRRHYATCQVHGEFEVADDIARH